MLTGKFTNKLLKKIAMINQKGIHPKDLRIQFLRSPLTSWTVQAVVSGLPYTGKNNRCLRQRNEVFQYLMVDFLVCSVETGIMFHWNCGEFL